MDKDPEQKDQPGTIATTAELMLMLGKNMDESLDIHNDLENITKK